MIYINFLQHRRNYLDLVVYFLNRIKPELKKQIRLNVLATNLIDLPEIDKDIVASYVYFGGHISINNYRDKAVRMIAEGKDNDKIIKLDEDIFFSEHVWNFLIENQDALDDPKTLLLTPVVNIGVPTCDMFIEDFCSQEQKEHLDKLFLSTDLDATAGTRWAITDEFKQLNKHTTGATTWNPAAYWSTVDGLQTTLKGIHPVRVNFDAQKYLGDVVLGNIPKFLGNNEMRIDTTHRPYLCNDTCMMKCGTYRRIFEEKGFNPYDELEMNAFRRENDMRFGFIRNGFAAHTMFAFVAKDHKERIQNSIHQKDTYEHTFYTKLKNGAKELNYYDLVM